MARHSDTSCSLQRILLIRDQDLPVRGDHVIASKPSRRKWDYSIGSPSASMLAHLRGANRNPRTSNCNARGAFMKVGFIGLGNMGLGMAAKLLKAGHEVTVYNRTPEKAKKLVEQGAKSAAAVADACKGDAVITMLADDNALEQVVFGDAGIISSLGKDAIHVSASTISVALAD